MANPVKGEVPLVLKDGRYFSIVLDMEALVEAESAYGKPLGKLMADAAQGFMGATAAVLQGALSRHHQVTRGEVLAMLGTDQEAVTDALSKAGEAAFPEVSAGGNVSGAPAKPRGKSSGRSGAKRG